MDISNKVSTRISPSPARITGYGDQTTTSSHYMIHLNHSSTSNQGKSPIHSPSIRLDPRQLLRAMRQNRGDLRRRLLVRTERAVALDPDKSEKERVVALSSKSRPDINLRKRGTHGHGQLVHRLVPHRRVLRIDICGRLVTHVWFPHLISMTTC